MTRTIGIVGLGNAATTLHLPALAGIDGVAVAGGCDPDPERRRVAGERFGVVAVPTLDRLLDESRPDLVVVCTPPESHLDICLAALKSGADVVCEKPFAQSLEQADRIVEAARERGRTVALNHEFRHVPIYEALHERIGRPGVGELVFAQAWQTMDLPPWREAGWRSELLQGTLYEAGIHLLDYLLHLFGERPVAVTATTSSCGAHEAESDAVALVTLEFSRGRLAQLTQNRLCPGDVQYFEVRADCEHASLRASFGGRARLSAGLYRSRRPHLRWEWGPSGIAWAERGDRRERFASNPKDPAMVGTRRLLERTIRALAEGSPVPVSAEDGRLTLEVIGASYESARTGTRIELPGSA